MRIITGRALTYAALERLLGGSDADRLRADWEGAGAWPVPASDIVAPSGRRSRAPKCGARGRRLPWLLVEQFEQAQGRAGLGQGFAEGPGRIGIRNGVAQPEPQEPHPGQPVANRPSSADLIPCARLDRPDSQGCTGRSKGIRIRCIPLALP